MNFLPEIPLTQFQAEAIARGLFAIAHADGLHEREAALVAAFWSETGGSERALAELSRRDAITTEELGAVLPTPELRRVFLKTALLLAFADGQVSSKESEMVRGFAKELALDSELSTLEAQVKEYLLGQLAHIDRKSVV